jgi:cardiolipin synthase
MVVGAVALAVVAVTAFVWPKMLAWPVGLFCAWLAVTLAIRAARVRPARPPAA